MNLEVWTQTNMYDSETRTFSSSRTDTMLNQPHESNSWIVTINSGELIIHIHYMHSINHAVWEWAIDFDFVTNESSLLTHQKRSLRTQDTSMMRICFFNDQSNHTENSEDKSDSWIIVTCFSISMFIAISRYHSYDT